MGVSRLLFPIIFHITVKPFKNRLKCVCLLPELKELVDLHKEDTDANEDPLSHDEVMIIQVASL